jgi:UDP-galactopyranose mutase
VSITPLVPRARRPDILCFSHLRWRSVYQRPHHLMSRAARSGRVYWVEEPDVGEAAGISIEHVSQDLSIVVPTIVEGAPDGSAETVARLLGEVLAAERVEAPILWYYTPIALRWTRDIEPVAVVYDCMDELSGFANAAPMLPILETKLLTRADLVFAGGASLFEAKRDLARSVHLFPSSVEADHFRTARTSARDPIAQAAIPRPRLGYAGVVDERMDLSLVRDVADARPDWHIVLVGPVAKIDDNWLPRGENIHYLGQQPYQSLPAFLAGWDAGILPFAHNEATRFISPTKVPEYLAAGLPVVSTSIRDVVRPYAGLGLASIGDGPDAFIAAVERALNEDRGTRIATADHVLARTSWDRTWREMSALVDGAVAPRMRPSAVRLESAVVAEAS